MGFSTSRCPIILRNLKRERPLSVSDDKCNDDCRSCRGTCEPICQRAEGDRTAASLNTSQHNCGRGHYAEREPEIAPRIRHGAFLARVGAGAILLGDEAAKHFYDSGEQARAWLTSFLPDPIQQEVPQ